MLSVTLQRIIRAPIGGDTPQPPLVVQGLGEGFGFTQVVEHAPKLPEWGESAPQVEPEINSLLTQVATLWEMLQGDQGPLKPGPASS